MGRLFWKFFLFFWLAQLVTSLGVGVMIWALRDDHPPPAAGVVSAPPFARGQRPPPDAFDRERAPPPAPPRRSLLPPALPLIAGSIVSLAFAALLAAYFARPIGSLRAALGSVSRGRLDIRVSASMGGRRDELAELGDEFDRMAERLRGVLDGQRRLLHDVSHELRSPLARIQAAADLMRQQPERSGRYVERIERDIGRMDGLVGELLTLARLDAPHGRQANAVVELAELLAHVVEDADIEAEARPCRIELSCAGSVAVDGDEGLLRRAVENVVRNAIRHSPPGGQVRIVCAWGVAERVLIEIADDGAGVAAAELDAIFAPFYRGSGARGHAGYGLGLAITKRVIEAHGGTVRASNRGEGGLAVSLSLPCKRPRGVESA